MLALWSLLQRQYAAPTSTASSRAFPTRPTRARSIPTTATGRRPSKSAPICKLLSSYTRTIRTYSSTGGVELVPGIAAEFGLKVTVGIWIDKNEARNEREIQSAIALRERYSNVNAIVVGNETTLRAEKTVDELIKIIQRVSA